MFKTALFHNSKNEGNEGNTTFLNAKVHDTDIPTTIQRFYNIKFVTFEINQSINQ